MGEKGSKMNVQTTELAERILSKMSGIDGISHKKMFGGYGIFQNEKMFCIVDSKGQSFLRIDDALKSDLASKGAIQHSRMPYYSIPESILDDDAEFQAYVKRAIALVHSS